MTASPGSTGTKKGRNEREEGQQIVVPLQYERVQFPLLEAVWLVG